MKTSMEHWCNDTDREKGRNLGQNLSQCCHLFPPHLPHRLAKGRDERPETNRLSHDTAVKSEMILHHVNKDSIRTSQTTVCIRKTQFIARSLRTYEDTFFCQITWFLGAFAKLQKATISFVMRVCPSVRPHGTTQLPLDEFWWNLVFEHFLCEGGGRICRGNSSFIKIRQE